MTYYNELIYLMNNDSNSYIHGKRNNQALPMGSPYTYSISLFIFYN